MIEKTAEPSWVAVTILAVAPVGTMTRLSPAPAGDTTANVPKVSSAPDCTVSALGENDVQVDEPPDSQAAKRQQLCNTRVDLAQRVRDARHIRGLTRVNLAAAARVEPACFHR
ncbi:hypothetical protein [Cryobacterium sp. Y62]|uniref:hypothetical protein n=1 Tax=Cryobacterium sp. Y62 TaxID=2048284 RepID=UPI00130482D8|nr:hypothetical protein [Cryobacterium sp. Y62]